MKKLFVLLLALSLLSLCACKNSVVDDLPDDVPDSPGVTGENAADPTDGATIDWETPIDVDDFFNEELESDIDKPDDIVTDPADENEPTAADTTGSQSKPTEPNATEPTPTEPKPTQPAPTEPVETNRPGSSGPIELPMIPG